MFRRALSGLSLVVLAGAAALVPVTASAAPSSVSPCVRRSRSRSR